MKKFFIWLFIAVLGIGADVLTWWIVYNYIA